MRFTGPGALVLHRQQHPHFLEVFTNASVDSQGRVGLAWEVSTQAGLSFVGSAAYRKQVLVSDAEAYVIEAAMDAVYEAGIRSLKVLSDCKSIIQYLNGGDDNSLLPLVEKRF